MSDSPQRRGSTSDDAAPPDPAEPEPTEDTNALASADDFLVRRNERGEVEPVREPVPGKATDVLVIPLSNGKANRLLDGDVVQGGADALTDDAMLSLVHEHIHEPDLSHVESVEEFTAFGLDPLVMAIFNASGFDLMRGMAKEVGDVEGIEGNTNRGN